MSIKSKWNAYVGPKDERLEAEENKVYAKACKVLLVLCLVTMYYTQRLITVAHWEGLVSDKFAFGTLRPDLFLSIMVIIVCVWIVGRFTKRGAFDSNRFAQTDEFPVGYAALCSAAGGVGCGVGVFVMNVLAEVQILGLGGTFWMQNALIGLFLGTVVFALCMPVYYYVFRSAKKNREKAEALLEDE